MGQDDICNSKTTWHFVTKAGNIGLLQEILQCYNIANLWAAIGWFLERFRKNFHVPKEVLYQMVQYLERNRRGGILATQWNLLLPKDLVSLGEPSQFKCCKNMNCDK